MKLILVKDLETTGLDPNKHCIVESYGALVDTQSWTVVEDHHYYIKPYGLWGAEAQKVHGYTYDFAATNGITIEEYVKHMQELGNQHEKLMYAGQNIAFDLAFDRKAFEYTHSLFNYDYHTLDLTSIMFLHNLKFKNTRKLGLIGFAEDYYGKEKLKNFNFHHAKDDVLMTIELFRDLLKDLDIQDVSYYAPQV